MSDQDFFAELRHDLANPINQIIGFAELIEEDLEDDQPCKVDDLRKIRTAAQVLQGLVKTRIKPNAVHALIEDTLEKPGEQPFAPQAFPMCLQSVHEQRWA